MATASIHVMNLERAKYAANTEPMLSHINVGCGEDVSIIDAARLVARTVGYAGEIKTDPGKQDGAPRKLMNSTRLNALGWVPRINLSEGLALAYQDFQKEHLA